MLRPQLSDSALFARVISDGVIVTLKKSIFRAPHISEIHIYVSEHGPHKRPLRSSNGARGQKPSGSPGLSPVRVMGERRQGPVSGQERRRRSRDASACSV